MYFLSWNICNHYIYYRVDRNSMIAYKVYAFPLLLSRTESSHLYSADIRRKLKTSHISSLNVLRAKRIDDVLGLNVTDEARSNAF